MARGLSKCGARSAGQWQPKGPSPLHSLPAIADESSYTRQPDACAQTYSPHLDNSSHLTQSTLFALQRKGGWSNAGGGRTNARYDQIFKAMVYMSTNETSHLQGWKCPAPKETRWIRRRLRMKAGDQVNCRRREGEQFLPAPLPVEGSSTPPSRPLHLPILVPFRRLCHCEIEHLRYLLSTHI